MGIPQETVMKILVHHEKNKHKLLLLSCYPFPVDLLPFFVSLVGFIMLIVILISWMLVAS